MIPDSFSQLCREFDLGVEAARDPMNAASLLGGQAVTTTGSRWFYRKCPDSGHTFRRGDIVTISPNGDVRLTEAQSLLQLEQSATSSEGNYKFEQIEEEFFGGLWEAWPPPSDLMVFRLGAGSPLVTRHEGFKRRTCAVCGHTLRPGDLVIICPCSPERPLCETAIHRDPIHGLHCWENWNPESRRTHCPITSRKLDE